MKRAAIARRSVFCVTFVALLQIPLSAKADPIVPESLNVNLTGSRGVAISSWAPGRLDVWATGANRVVYHNSCTGNCFGGWGAWDDIGGAIYSRPAVVSWGPNHIDVFGLDSNGGVLHRAFDNGSWSNWDTTFGGSGGVDIAASSQFSGNVTVWVLQADGRIDERDVRNGTMASWISVPNSAAVIGADPRTRLSVTSWGAGRLDLMAYNYATKKLVHTAGTPSGFSAWDNIPDDPLVGVGGVKCGADGATIVSRGYGKLVTLCTLQQAAQMHSSMYTEGVGWTPWSENFDYFAIYPNVFFVRSAVSWDSTRTDVLLLGVNNVLYHAVLRPTTSEACVGHGECWPLSSFCELASDGCGTNTTGTCMNKPTTCDLNSVPSCGCDGRTYGNDCQRQAAGKPRWHDGYCTPAGCPASAPQQGTSCTPANMSCVYSILGNLDCVQQLSCTSATWSRTEVCGFE